MSSSEESEISEEEYSDEDSSSSSSDESSSDDSDDEGRKKSSRWRRRHRQLRRRAQETQEEAEQTYKQEQQMLELEDDLEQNPETFYNDYPNPLRSEEEKAAATEEILKAEAEAQAAADALAREEAEAEAKAEEMRRQQALLAAMMSALAMIKMNLKQIQSNITKLKKNKPETENLVMAPTLLWTCQVNGLAKSLATDIAIDTAIKLATRCITFKNVKELRKKITESATWSNARDAQGRLQKTVKQLETLEEIQRAQTILEKAKTVKDHVGSEAASRVAGGGLTGKSIKIGSKVWSKGLKKGILDRCDLPMMFVRVLFGKYPEECREKADIEEFFKYPGRAPFESILAADQFYGKILAAGPPKQKPVLAGGKYVPPSKEMESALQKRRTKRKTDDTALKRTADVFSDTGVKSAVQIENMLTEQKENTNYVRTQASMQEEIKNTINVAELTAVFTDPKTRQNIGYWASGVFQENAQSLIKMLPVGTKSWLVGLVLDDNPVPYCTTGCLTDALGLWVKKLNINLNFGPNFTYDHYGCIFAIDLEGERELQPYYNPHGVKNYMKDHLDSRYIVQSRAFLSPHAPHAGHVKFQLRRMYQRAIDVGFKPALEYKSKIIVEDELLKSYCECFQNWSEDMETQNKALQDWDKMKTVQEMSIINQYQKIQNMQSNAKSKN